MFSTPVDLSFSYLRSAVEASLDKGSSGTKQYILHNLGYIAKSLPHCNPQCQRSCNVFIHIAKILEYIKGLNTKYMKFPFDPWISVLGEFLFNLSFRKIKYNTVLRSETYCRPLFSTCISGVMQRYSGFTRRKVAITPYTPAKWWPWSTMREGGWAV